MRLDDINWLDQKGIEGLVKKPVENFTILPVEMDLGEDEVAITPVHDVDFQVQDHNAMVKGKALKFASLIDAGQTPAAAAKQIGTTLKKLNSNAEMAIAIQEIIDAGNFSAELKKTVLRAGMLKIFVEGMTSDNPRGRKLAIEAYKEMRVDPDIGLGKDDVNVGVEINLGGLGDIIRGQGKKAIEEHYPTIDIEPEKEE